LQLANPVLVAAGTFGYGVEFRRAVRLDQLGGMVTKTITLQPRQGNPPPRLVETPSGMLNSVGVQNVGLEAFLRDKLPLLAAVDTPLIVSVLGETLGEITELCSRLDAYAIVAAIELNLSCPNLKNGSRLKAQGSRQGTLEPAAYSLEPAMVAQDADATFECV